MIWCVLVARVEALQAFLKTDDGVNLLAGYKRAANILKAEEKKDAKTFTSEVLESHLSEPAEKIAVRSAGQPARWSQAASPLEKQDFTAAMAAAGQSLRAPIDAFFVSVTVKVNADANKRANRLALLDEFRAERCTRSPIFRVSRAKRPGQNPVAF